MAKRSRSQSQSSYDGSQSESGSDSSSGAPASGPRTASSILTTLVQSAAKAETNLGLTKGGKKSVKRRFQQKPKTRKAVEDLDTKELIGQIVIVPSGLMTSAPRRRSKRQRLRDISGLNQQPVDETFPDIVDVQALEAIGLACMNHSTGLVIHKNWTHLDIDKFIRTQCPRFAEYIDTLPPILNPDYEEGKSEARCKYLPQYLLCTKDNRKLVLTPNSLFPDGQKVSINVHDSQRRGFAHKFLVLCTHDPINLSFFGVPSCKDDPSNVQDEHATNNVEEFVQGSSSGPQTRASTRTVQKRKFTKHDSFDDQLDEAWATLIRK